MFRIRLLAAALFLPICFASISGDTSTATEARIDSWRQTRQGWQRCEDFLGPPVEYRRPALHPAVVGSLEVLLTMTAMLALSDDAANRRRKNLLAG
jgi:hypothetical protein